MDIRTAGHVDIGPAGVESPTENSRCNGAPAVPGSDPTCSPPLTKKPGRKKESAKELTQEKETFFVEKILKKATREGKTMYLVKWKFYDSSHNTWEPPGSFSPELLEQYETGRMKRERGRKSKGPGRKKARTGDLPDSVPSPETASNSASLPIAEKQEKKVKEDDAAKTPGLSADDVAQLELMTLDIPTLDIPSSPDTESSSTTIKAVAVNGHIGNQSNPSKMAIPASSPQPESQSGGSSPIPIHEGAELLPPSRQRRSRQPVDGPEKKRNGLTADQPSTSGSRRAATKKPGIDRHQLHESTTGPTGGKQLLAKSNGPRSDSQSPSKFPKMEMLLSSKKVIKDKSPGLTEPARKSPSENLGDATTNSSNVAVKPVSEMDWTEWTPELIISEFTLITDGDKEVLFEEVRLRPSARPAK